ncbi:hypothetical protein PBI_KAMPE_104 [Gordonia phage Kampe]|uniref:Uncharacterized protein n=3 Tax=Gordonia phage Orchid TaxID=1838075 RepID=A0A160DHM3_9CAUD|nr:hypothetical protein BH761_gp110 [Gordonia phage Orchid]ANA87336.1 hypothetical protein PBI_PATRICKSTAR_104 [Gordonia phage PatrickStar]ANA87447.1 hypothetical protein PBI_ORCHID_103 [Gordonia phage Orchid]ANA87562.1 hypothetical protein PBI_KAMPE_104 [Gordonia phage Kampe]
MKVTVTQEHIDKGKRWEICNCPIALALKEKGFNNVEVSTFEISASKHNDLMINHYRVPSVAKRFIKSFDDGHPVEPFTFEARKYKDEN